MRARRRRTSHSVFFSPPGRLELGDVPGAHSEQLLTAAVLPVQFFSAPHPSSRDCGERALMRAVLEDALGCFTKRHALSGRRTSRLAREAEAWFFADDDHWPFAFVNICAVLGLDPAYIRLGLARWRPDPPAQPQKQKKQRAIPRQWPLKTAA